MKIWYTSDLHFFHYNIIRLCNRPFTGVEEMNNKLIENYNNVVSDTDAVYLLGDIAFKNKDISDTLSKLKGIKHLIVGNHDHSAVTTWSGWASVRQYHEFYDDKRFIVLFHYPILEWNQYHRGSYHLHGHVHGNLKPYHANAFDVGVDAQNYKPVLLNDLITKEQ